MACCWWYQTITVNTMSLHLKPRNLQGFTCSRIKRSTSSTWPFKADISVVETWLTHCENLKGSPSTPREISLVTSADEMALLVNRSLLLSGWLPSIPVSWWSSSATTSEETNSSKQIFFPEINYSQNFSKTRQVFAIAKLLTDEPTYNWKGPLTFPSLVAFGWSQWNEQWFCPFCCKLAKQGSSSLQPLSLWAPHTSTFTHSLMPLSVSCKQLEISVPFGKYTS